MNHKEDYKTVDEESRNVAMFLGIAVVLAGGLGALIYDVAICEPQRLCDEYNQAAKEEGWLPITPSSGVEEEDVRRAILMHKMHIKPTVENVMNAPKRPINNTTVLYMPSGR